MISPSQSASRSQPIKGEGGAAVSVFTGMTLLRSALGFGSDWLFSDLRIPAFAGMTGRQSERRLSDSPIEFSVNPPLQAHQCRGDLSLAIRARFRLNGVRERKLQKPMFDKRRGGL